MNRTLFWMLILLCPASGQAQLIPGLWRFELELAPGRPLPFHIEFVQESGSWQAWVRNGAERLPMEAPRIQGDSLFLRSSVFHSGFRGRFLPEDRIEGIWQDFSRKGRYTLPFRAEYGVPQRFPLRPGKGRLSPVWAATFSPGTDNAYPAVGLFTQNGSYVTGTFLTETGDYRYLEGAMDGDSLRLSAFDGSHAFLFTAGFDQNGHLKGTFYSGSHWQEPWTARPDPQAALTDPDSLTYLLPGYERLAFSFPNPEGRMVSLADPAYQGKVVIVQVLGSWCPNCMDESKQLAAWHRRYQREGLEIIGLAFERTGDTASSLAAIRRLKQALGLPYEVLLASTSTDKALASQALPMLNHIMAYPTAIYLDRQGRIRKIHTGYYGPGTGAYHTRFVEQYTAFIEALLRE